MKGYPMKPIKFAEYLAKQRSNAPQPVIDLRDYGLASSAPQEDGHTILTLRINPQNGTLLPAA